MHRMRRHFPEMARQMPALRRVEHASGKPCRARTEKRPLPILGGGYLDRPIPLRRYRHRSAAQPDRHGRTRPRIGRRFVDGAVILLGGDPGIGKSTLLLQTIAKMAQSRKVLYVPARNPPNRSPCARNVWNCPPKDVNLLAEIRMEAIQTALKQHQPEVVVIDSIQTMYSDQITSAPGSVSRSTRMCRPTNAYGENRWASP